MPQPICHIVGAGALYRQKIRPAPGDFVIAADGGYAALSKRGLRPDLLVGDFDSLPGSIQVEAGLPVLRHPPEKDDTDMALAVEAGMIRGFRVFHIYGGTGGRLDHTLANLQLLAALSRAGARGVLLSNGSAATAVTGAALSFDARNRGPLSVFAHGGDARGVTLVNLKYQLTNATLSCERPLGVSNAFIGARALVSVRAGTLIVWWRRAGAKLPEAAQAAP